MADIARLAGVSVSSVSRALSGSPMIGSATRQRIMELASSLNYSINVGAQSLRTKNNRTVAVVVPYSSDDRHHLSEPFFLSLIGSLADALINRGLRMLLTRADGLDANLVDSVESGQAMAVVTTGPWRQHEQCNRIALAGIPFVAWGAPMERQLYATVGSDNRQGGLIATEHLLALGARRVAFLGDIEAPEGAQRHQGYVQAHQARGLEVDPGLHRASPHLGQAVQRDVESLLAAEPRLDAIFASGDLIAMNAIATLRRNGRRVPEDVSVVGFDDIELAAYFHPALTTVRQPIARAGVEIVNSLVAQIGGEPPLAQQLPTELIRRDSTLARPPTPASAPPAAVPSATARKRREAGRRASGLK